MPHCRPVCLLVAAVAADYLYCAVLLQVLGATAACLSLPSVGTAAPAAFSMLLKKSDVPLQNSFTVVRGHAWERVIRLHSAAPEAAQRDYCHIVAAAETGWRAGMSCLLLQPSRRHPPPLLRIAAEVRQGRDVLLHLPPLLALPQRLSGPLHHHSRPHPHPGPLLGVAPAGPDVSSQFDVVCFASSHEGRLLTPPPPRHCSSLKATATQFKYWSKLVAANVSVSD